jgi:hypothetical protein
MTRLSEQKADAKAAALGAWCTSNDGAH